MPTLGESSTRTPVLARLGNGVLRPLAEQVGLLLGASDGEFQRERVYLAIGGVIIGLIITVLLLALLRWIRNLLVVILVVLIATVLRSERVRRHESVGVPRYRIQSG